MIIALACSFIVTWLIVPVLYMLFSRSTPIRKETKSNTNWIRYFLKRPASGIGFALICVLILFIVPSRLASGFLPEMDEGSIVLDFYSPPGTTMEETDRMLTVVNGILDTIPEVEAYSLRLGTQMGFFITEPNRGDYLIKLKDRRSATTTEVSDVIRRQIEAAVPPLTIDFGQVIGDMLGDLMSSVQPIEIKVFGDNNEQLQTLARQIAGIVEQVDGTADVSDGIIVAGPEIIVSPKVRELAQLGLTPAEFQVQLETQVQGTVISTMIDREQIINIRLIYPGAQNKSVEDVKRSTLLLPGGAMVPLGNVATVSVGHGVAEINRENQKSMAVVTARLNDRDLGSTLSDIQTELSKTLSMPPGYHLEYGGEYKEQQQAFKELLMILASAVLLVFTVILFLFRRIKIALVIIFVAILGVAGCLLGLYITGIALNVGSYTGIIMIVGIIGENSIFTYRQYQESGAALSHRDKLEYAIAARLRPKLMTAFAAIMALIPLALGFGAGAQLHQPLAIAVIGGLIFALPLLLVVLPILLYLLKE
jgi:Cu/Ag efflux pump CusA